MPTEGQTPIVEEKPLNNIFESTEDFFADTKDADFDDFIKNMQTPKEKMPDPSAPAADGPGTTSETDDPAPDSKEALKEQEKEENARKLAEYLDYSPEQYATAEFIMFQVDRAFAFVAHLVTGEKMETYQLRLEDTPSRKKETELAAALVNKYQMRLSLEIMFLIAISMAYAPVANKARQELKEKRKNKQGNTTYHNHQQQPIQ